MSESAGCGARRIPRPPSDVLVSASPDHCDGSMPPAHPDQMCSQHLWDWEASHGDHLQGHSRPRQPELRCRQVRDVAPVTEDRQYW